MSHSRTNRKTVKGGQSSKEYAESNDLQDDLNAQDEQDANQDGAEVTNEADKNEGAWTPKKAKHSPSSKPDAGLITPVVSAFPALQDASSIPTLDVSSPSTVLVASGDEIKVPPYAPPGAKVDSTVKTVVEPKTPERPKTAPKETGNIPFSFELHNFYLLTIVLEICALFTGHQEGRFYAVPANAASEPRTVLANVTVGNGGQSSNTAAFVTMMQFINSTATNGRRKLDDVYRFVVLMQGKGDLKKIFMKSSHPPRWSEVFTILFYNGKGEYGELSVWGAAAIKWQAYFRYLQLLFDN